jgi:ankyrin repeat protein
VRIRVISMTARNLLLAAIVIASTGIAEVPPSQRALELHIAARGGDEAAVRQILSSADAPDPNSLVDGKTPLIAALEGRHAQFDKRWAHAGALPFSPTLHSNALAALLELGADAAMLCPTLEAATYRNVPALRRLLAQMNHSAARECLASGDSEGRTPWHVCAESPAAGLARVLSRANRMRANSADTAAAHAELRNEVSLSEVPAFVGARDCGRGGCSPTSGVEGLLTKATIERALGTVDLEVLAERFFASGGDARAFGREVGHDARGLTPLLVACQSGRVGVVRRLLSLGLSDATLEASVEGEGPLARSPLIAPLGSRCSHLAAFRGHVDVLRAVFEEGGGRAALAARDASGKTACSRVANAGSLLRPAALALEAYGACDAAINAPPSSARSAGLRIRHFDADALVAQGWRCASAAQLRDVGLPADFFNRSRSAPATPEDWPDGRLARRVAGVEIASMADARQIRRFQSQSRPFLVERAFDPASLVSVKPGETQRGAFVAQFGGLAVMSATIPYASTYGEASEQAQNISQFVKQFMGRSRQAANASVQAKEGAVLPGQAEGGDGPGMDLERPPYVFDGGVLRRKESMPLFAPFFRWLHKGPGSKLGKRAAKLLQLALGPPLSGAMPHFHPDAANVLVFGLKLWLVWAPQDAAFSGSHARDFFREWLRSEGPAAGETPTIAFLQEPGDLVFVPAHFGHAILNLADSLALAVE